MDELGNMLYDVKDKLSGQEFKQLYEQISQVREEKESIYYEVTWLKLEMSLGPDDQCSSWGYWKHVIEKTIVIGWEGVGGEETPQWLNEHRLGRGCVVNMDTQKVWFHDDNYKFISNPDCDDAGNINLVSGGYFISMRKL